MRLRRNSKSVEFCTCHAGLDPASNSVTLSESWIPGQARNDKNTNVRSLVNCDTAFFLKGDRGELKDEANDYGGS